MPHSFSYLPGQSVEYGLILSIFQVVSGMTLRPLNIMVSESGQQSSFLNEVTEHVIKSRKNSTPAHTESLLVNQRQREREGGNV